MMPRRSSSSGERVLITGGAGFIGSHVADALLARGYQVRVLDSLDAQVHGEETHGQRPPYLASEVELVRGDVRDPDAVTRALEGVDMVFHLAAAVGVGQSMYEIVRYTDVNNLGTAVLLEALLKQPVRRLVVASSMSIYGEGAYARPDGSLVAPAPRELAQLRRAEWEVRDVDGTVLAPVPTTEEKAAMPESVYALSKYDQEKLCLLFGRAYDVPVVALRFFNVYGERQALSNPYTGVLAIFAARYLNGRAPRIFEDGEQRRDFVHVRDLAQACVLALESTQVRDAVFNVGSGESQSIASLAERLGRVVGMEHIAPEITGQYRAGDIRHCFADISTIRTALGFEPRIALDDGLAELAAWLETQQGEDKSDEAARQLALRGLVA
jgi:dTDP-L-rhamnose 4-epimerase